MALDLVEHLAPLGHVRGAPLTDEQVAQHGIVDVALILELIGHVRAEEIIVGVEERCLRSKGHGLVLAVEGGADVRAVLLLYRLGVDADVLQVLQDQLDGVDLDGRAVRGIREGGREAVGMARLGQELLGPPRIELVVLGAFAELVHGKRPVLEGSGHGRIEDADAFGHRIEKALAVEGERDGPAHPDVIEGWLVRAHVDMAHLIGGELQALELRPPLLERVLDLHPVHPIDRPRSLPPDVVLARDEGGHARGIVLVHCHLDLVDIGQAAQEVAGVPDEGETDIRPVAVQHPGTGADHRLGLLEVTELLHGLAGDDGEGHRIGDHVEEPDVRLLEGELDGVLVDHLDLVQRRHHVAIGIALLVHEAIEGVLDVVGGELAPVHGGLRVPAHAFAELEDVGRLVRLGPRLGEVALEGEGAGLHPRPRLVLQEPAVGEGVEDIGLVGDSQVGIEVRRIPQS